MAEKAAKTEALTKAEARLKSIETSAKEAEQRMSAAEQAAAEAKRAEATGPSEAETREAAVSWLRGQIAALRQELGKSGSDNPGEGS